MKGSLKRQSDVDMHKPKARPYEVRDTQTKGFILRVQPSGVKTYYCEYDRGQREKIGRAENFTPKQARAKAFKILGGEVKEKKGADPTLGAFIDDDYAPWVKANRKDGAATIERLQACFDEFLAKRLSEINAWIVEKWRSKRLKAGIRPATINRDITTLKAALSKAVEWGTLSAHPLATIKPLKVDSMAKVRYLTKDEEGRLRRVLDAARGRTPRLLKPLVLLAINTGMRRGELFHLTWQNMDFTTKVITVAGERAKSGSTRHIPMNAEAVQLMKDWQKESEGVLVFPGRDGAPLNNVKKSWATVLKAAGIEGFRFHDLRHTFASNLVMAGVDINTVRDLLGHGDLKMTLRYAHLAPEHKAAAVELLGAG